MPHVHACVQVHLQMHASTPCGRAGNQWVCEGRRAGERACMRACMRPPSAGNGRAGRRASGRAASVCDQTANAYGPSVYKHTDVRASERRASMRAPSAYTCAWRKLVLVSACGKRASGICAGMSCISNPYQALHTPVHAHVHTLACMCAYMHARTTRHHAAHGSAGCASCGACPNAAG